DDHVHEFFRQGQHRISFAKGFPKLILPDSFFQRSKMAKVELRIEPESTTSIFLAFKNPEP
ncbi:MAG: hypothetical protein K1Y36_29880, partial [Blastocatellia bacterium]|nr:hypothetical protein [Blastocatellia bacterium]